MDIAAAVGPERLREIMGSVFDTCSSVVRRYQGTVGSFTGDGIMAVFGAPIALEDHAFRACLAALDIQAEIAKPAGHATDLALRIGLNSGQVIAGEIGSGSAGYTAIGEQVGMAQRMESVAPPGKVMLSESTARLVHASTILGAPQLVQIKGSDTPVPARLLLALTTDTPQQRNHTTLVGRSWELGAVSGLLDDVTDGTGGVVTIAGPPGIGKSRLVREAAFAATERNVAVFSTYCESHTGDVAFRVVARLLRAVTGIGGLDAASARASVRAQFPDADPQDLLLLDDLLGIADATIPLPEIAAEARRRRLTTFVNTASLARTTPALFIIEDVHWIDQSSESLIADFLAVIPQTPSLVLITHRPEYNGPLSRMADAQSMRLRPLKASQTAMLTTELLGTDPSVAALSDLITERASGNPFFVEEIVRDLAEQGAIMGQPGRYRQHRNIGAIDVPASLQATIAARIDRLPPSAKATLSAAAVIGARFDATLLGALISQPAVDDLIAAQLVDQVRYTPQAEYAFHHPMIRSVSYTTQLQSARAELHRRLVAAIDHTDENAALIAEHLESAGDFTEALDWHMRAGSWAINRDVAAAHTSWKRARQLADGLSIDYPDRVRMRIAPRALITATAWRAGHSGDSGFDELRELCDAAGDQRSLAMGMAGQIITLDVLNRRREASRLASELVAVLNQIGDPTLTVAAGISAVVAKFWTAEISELLEVAELVLDASGGDVTAGNLVVGSPVAVVSALRGTGRWCLGLPGWRDDLQASINLARSADPATRAVATVYIYLAATPNGVLLSDATALRETAEALDVLERGGDDFSLDEVRITRAVLLACRGDADRAEATELFARLRDDIVNDRWAWLALPIIDTHIAAEKARLGDLDDAITLARSALDDLYRDGGSVFCAPATTVLVETLLARAAEGDLSEAQAAIDRLAAASPTDPGMAPVMLTSLRLRALLAKAIEDQMHYHELRDRYRTLATDLGFEGHMAWAAAMQ